MDISGSFDFPSLFLAVLPVKAGQYRLMSLQSFFAPD